VCGDRNVRRSGCRGLLIYKQVCLSCFVIACEGGVRFANGVDHQRDARDADATVLGKTSRMTCFQPFSK
jgi:hypothetical protein